MGTSSFQAGAEVAIQGTTYTLLRKISGSLWQTENLKTKRIHELSDHELQTYYSDGDLIFVTKHDRMRENDIALGKSFRNISPPLFELAKLKRAYVMAIIDLPSSKPVVEPVIREIWDRIKQPEAPPAASTVLKWKAKFLANGKDIISLLPNHENKGNREPRYPDDLIKIAKSAVRDLYMTLGRKTIQDTLDEAIIRVERENELRPEALRLPLPTRRLLTRLIGQIPAFDKWCARYGRMAAMKKFRSVQGHRTTNGPLERAEIDHTPLDLLVVDDETGLPLGRPHLTACIDDFSRCILGAFISFEPPSYLTVARCLRDCFLPKTSLRDRYPRVKHAWDSHGVMRELVVDNGPEFHSASLEAACFSLGMEIHYAPRKTAWFKGKIERYLASNNRGVAHGNPGTTFSNILEKDEYDPAKHAVIRLSTLQETIRIWIVDYYHQKPHRSLDLVPPATMWSSNIKSEDILLPDDPARLDAILGRIDTRKLTHKGIELEGMQYNSPELADLRRRLGDRFDVEIRIDDADLGKIIVLSPNKKEMFEARCLSFEYANGLSLWQHKVCKRFAATNLAKSNPMAWLEAKATIAKIIDEELAHKRRRSAKRLARYQGASSLHLSKVGLAAPPTPGEPAATTKALDSRHPAEGKPPKPTKRFEPIIRDRSAELEEAYRG